ncbi:hypothetical protein FCK19_16855 [Salmonella enterica]|nr:hypothetical protein [Salmonella enterica]
MSIFKPFLLCLYRRTTDGYRPVRKLFTPVGKGASIVMKMGMKRENCKARRATGHDHQARQAQRHRALLPFQQD